MQLSLKRDISILFVVLLPLTFLISIGGASASPSSSTTLSVAKNSPTYISSIRKYYFCSTAACKAAKSLLANASQLGVTGLKKDLALLKTASVPSNETATVAKYVIDANNMISAMQSFAKATTQVNATLTAGIIYYESANIDSDAYLLTCEEAKSKVSFAKWSVGVVGVTYAMQTVVKAESATTPLTDLLSINKNLLIQAASLTRDANGPSAAFNAAAKNFAATIATNSEDSILVLTKKAPASMQATLASLAKKLQTEFSAMAALQNKLAK